MLSNPAQIAEIRAHPPFQAGDEIVLNSGPHKFLCGKFVALKDDVEWASMEEPNGDVSSHPVEWMLRKN